MSALETDRPLGPHVTVLAGSRGGKYPDGNALLVRGCREAAIIDPALAVRPRAGALGPVAHVLNSHVHEDHVAGNGMFPTARWHVPAADHAGIRSLDGLMRIYGFDATAAAAFRRVVVEEFHFTPRPDADAFEDGFVLDLGEVEIRAIHAPGHTRGHSCFHILPDDVLYLGDIDLSSFGPYYGDAWSSLEDFERTLARVRAMDARWYATFHHVGVLDGRATFLERLDRFAAVIARREAALCDFLTFPRTLDEIVAHRFVYRPGDAVPFADAVERRSMTQHLDRLVREGRVRRLEPDRFVLA